MKKSRFTEEQITAALREGEAGGNTRESVGGWVSRRTRSIGGKPSTAAWTSTRPARTRGRKSPQATQIGDRRVDRVTEINRRGARTRVPAAEHEMRKRRGTKWAA